MSLSPMMQQYHEAKRLAGDALLLFRMGDFYELFFEDAKIAARTLGIALTSREKGEDAVPMAGFPFHQLDAYLAKIIAAGHRAAICEQVEDAKQAKGLVKREVTRIVTPGTLTDDALLDPQRSNYLAAIAYAPRSAGQAPLAGLAWIDVSTGRFHAAPFAADQLADQLTRIAPAELLLGDDAATPPREWGAYEMITRRPAWTFGRGTALETLAKHFGTHTLEGFGFHVEGEAGDGEHSAGTVAALRAAGAILNYLAETQRSSLDHIDRLVPFSNEERLAIDPATRRSLEIVATIRDGRRAGSLLGTLDRTMTGAGARLLADWLAAPLTNVGAINGRLDAVAELVADPTTTTQLRESLKHIYDIQRLLSRVTTGRASPRDLSHISRTLATLPKVKAKLSDRASALLCELESRIDLCADLRGPLEQALVEECPLTARDGGFIRAGYRADVDELRALMAGGKQWMAEYQALECQRTGIANIRVGFNSVFGYYLEITHTHREKIPSNYIRKQTLKNAERYITPELKEYEEKVLSAEDRLKQLEQDIFLQLRDLVARGAARLQATAEALAEIDVLGGLAELARSRNYVRPTVVGEPVLEIEAGRHPVLDLSEPEGTFVPNDVACAARSKPRAASRKPQPTRGNLTGSEDAMPTGLALDSRPSTLDTQASPLAPRPSFLLITGPNMAGKSTYIRQTALLALMAQIGSFVPARRATIGIADRIFARVGASDELARGQSTFMVEMTETARILNTATAQSLVILDEIGRGTSTYDGLSLAWSIVEHIHNTIGCRTLFATHYHELTDLEDQLDGVRNFNVAVKEWDDQVVFLHQIVPGAADKSYGIHVAQLAGVPRAVNDRAQQVLEWLEAQHEAAGSASSASSRNSAPPPHFASTANQASKSNGTHWQMTLFGLEEHPLLDEIRDADLEKLAPTEALELVRQWQRKLASNPLPTRR